jgi:hypothetical protein
VKDEVGIGAQKIDETISRICFSPCSALVSCESDDEALMPRPLLAYLSSPSHPSPSPCPAGLWPWPMPSWVWLISFASSSS